MQRFIYKQKNKIALISGILISLAFITKYAFNNVLIFNVLLIVSSIIGILPIGLQAYQSLKIKVVSIDVLVTLAVFGAFIIQNFEESAIVTFLFLFGAYLEQKTLEKTRSAIKELTELAPETAFKLMDNDQFEEVDIYDVKKGDIILVKTGGKVPVDGTVVTGEGHINEATITGESLPVKKNIDSNVYAGTILENGTIQIIADKVGEDTTFGKIIELVEEAQDSKSDAERFIDTFSKYYTPVVLILSIIVFVITKDVELSITILVLGCPGALVIGVPVSNVAGIGNGAKNGTLLKGSEVIKDFSKIDIMVFDKTGTLTVGNPEVSNIKHYNDNDKALDYLYNIEKESDHPLANAITNYIKDAKEYKVFNTKVIKGKGIISNINKDIVIVGNESLLKDENIKLNKKQLKDIKDFKEKGYSIVLTAVNKELNILIGIRDEVRPNVKENLNKLKKMGIKQMIVLSGDNQTTVNVISKELGLTKAYGNMLPEDKSNYIKKLQKEGNIVAFVGDGINDSPSLALANIGIAMGSGTDVAIETSDVVLMNSDFNKLPHAFGIAKATNKNMIQNIIIAVGVVFFLLANLIFSDWMNVSIGMLVHEGSILVVILNGMRLINYKLKERL